VLKAKDELLTALTGEKQTLTESLASITKTKAYSWSSLTRHRQLAKALEDQCTEGKKRDMMMAAYEMDIASKQEQAER
jgi:hypothetical protein